MDHKRKTDFTMPYKSSGIIISGTQYDRRQKLTPFQKAEIFHRYMTEAVSQRPGIRCQPQADNLHCEPRKRRAEQGTAEREQGKRLV